MPFWRGEAPGRSAELSQYVSKLREKIANNSEDPGLIDWLKLQGGLDESAAEQLLQYVREGRALLGAVPTQNTIIAERFFDETGGMQLIIHAPFGSRINKAWGLALRKKFCRSFNFELQAAATDDGLNISLAEQHSFPLSDVFQFLHPNSLTKTFNTSSFTISHFCNKVSVECHTIFSNSPFSLRQKNTATYFTSTCR